MHVFGQFQQGVLQIRQPSALHCPLEVDSTPTPEAQPNMHALNAKACESMTAVIHQPADL